MHPWITYGLLVLCALVALFAIWVADKAGHPRWKLSARFAVPLQLLALIGAYAVLRPGAGDDPREVAKRMEAAAAPTFVAFHSNYCGACLYARPAVDALAHDLAGKAQVSRLNIDERDGATLFRQHHFSAVPAFLLLDAQGRELYRQQGGTPQREQVLAALLKPAAQTVEQPAAPPLAEPMAHAPVQLAPVLQSNEHAPAVSAALPR